MFGWFWAWWDGTVIESFGVLPEKCAINGYGPGSTTIDHYGPGAIAVSCYGPATCTIEDP